MHERRPKDSDQFFKISRDSRKVPLHESTRMSDILSVWKPSPQSHDGTSEQGENWVF